MLRVFLLLLTAVFTVYGHAQKTITTAVLVVGGGTGGTAAGIQSARMGAKTLVVEPSPWMGGMISAAGVSAVDGNHRLPSGLWAEFRQQLYRVYGGPSRVETGWVSNTLFEPRIADSLFKTLARAESLLAVLHHYRFQSLQKKAGRVTAVRFAGKTATDVLVVVPGVVIDATELGDVMKAAGAAYDLGMEAGSLTGEKVGVESSTNIVQDLTYVATLKDFGAGADKTIPQPAGYDPAEFDGACTDYYHNKTRKAPTVDGKKMLEYGKLPNGKYMINWPNYGNDTYLNIVELPHHQREKELEKAKGTTLRFVYFIQQQLGFKNLGLADDEFPTADRLALMPYHREGRRVKGLVRLTLRHLAEPFTYAEPLYRTGISVGDYPIDHHHKKNEAAPQHLDFYPIPSFNVPLGALIPQRLNNLIVAEKGISVSNVVNGTTRLQPCVLLTGQAAGALAALSSKRGVAPKNVPVRAVQQALLQSKAYLMPYIDVTPDNPHWQAVQKIGATGILKGTGVPHKWANQTWFYPDSLVDTRALALALQDVTGEHYAFAGEKLSVEAAISVVHLLSVQTQRKGGTVKKTKALRLPGREDWERWGLRNFNPQRFITRLELAVLLNNTVDPFSMKAVNHTGAFVN